MASFAAIRALGLPVCMTAGCLWLAACATSEGPHITGSGRCNDSALGWAIGQPANEDNMRRLLLDSGAGLINPIGPDTNLLGDHRLDRLRVFIDAGNMITAARCE